jgi:hypothetical protein
MTACTNPTSLLQIVMLLVQGEEQLLSHLDAIATEHHKLAP